MMNSSLKELIPEEIRLVRQAKSGDANTFVQLYDVYVERVYRYIHFLAPNNRVAEGLTFQVFFKAWEHLVRFRVFGSSFVMWLYSIAQDQLIAFYRTHAKTVAPDSDFILMVKGGDFWREFQTIRDNLRFLTAEQQQVLILKFIVGMSNKDIARVMARLEDDVRVLQMHALRALAGFLEEKELRINTKGFQRILEECLMKLSNGKSTLDECLAHYPEYDTQLRPLLEAALLLNLGRNVKPSPTFNAYTRDALIQYMRSHPRRPQTFTPMFRRAALTFAMLVAALLVAGTAQAQSALPGDTFYGWKRTSEQVWRALSPNPVATDIMLADRRLNEWVVVANDPTRNTSAMIGYLEALARLKSTSDVETLPLITSALRSQQQILTDYGLLTSELDDYLVEAAGSTISTPASIQALATSIPSTTTSIPPKATEVLPTTTSIPPIATEVPPTTTSIPPMATEVPPTETEVPPMPTEVSPMPTEVPPMPTEIPPIPTEVPPMPTEVPPTPMENVGESVVPTIVPVVTPTEEEGIPN